MEEQILQCHEFLKELLSLLLLRDVNIFMAHATHKIRLYPNKSQSAWLKKACGISRFVYNWALTEWSKQYEEFKQDNTKPKPSRFSLSNQLNKLKISDPNLKWLTETSDQPAQNALQDLDTAFKKFFKKQASYPCFKKQSLNAVLGNTSEAKCLLMTN